ncbi:MAG: M23 family metallopeptidase [Acidimicrobiia bacterium]
MTRSLFVAAVLVLSLFATGGSAAAAEDLQFERFPQPAQTTQFHDDYGNARRGHRHQGNDIFGAKGDPVVAVLGGVVKTIDSGPTAGNFVIIEHAGGWETWYLHLKNDSPGTDNGRLGPEHAIGSRIEEGFYVPAGGIVGFVGDSGNAEGTEPHTHFELHHNGSTVNPYPYLIGVWTLEQQAMERLGAIL